jgi:hypothetical protein
MNEVVLRVHPAAGGWWVACDLPIEPVYFHSGARAEAAARSLAQTLSDAGHDTKVVINDRADFPVATQRYFAAV